MRNRPSADAASRRVGQALRAHRAYRRTARLLIFVLSVFFVAALALLVIAACHGALAHYRIHFLCLFCLWLLGSAVAAFFLLFRRFRLGGGQESDFRQAVVTTYVRGLLRTEYLRRREALLTLENGKALADLACELAEGYELSNEEMRVLMPDGGIALAGDLIGKRYAALLAYICSSPDGAARLLPLYRAYSREIDRWCRLHIGGYDPSHRPLIERGACRLRCHALFEYADFIAAEGGGAYLDLIPTLALYADPEHGEDTPRHIPKKEQYDRYREILRVILATDGSEGHLAMHGEGLANLTSAIEAYEAYAATYTLAGEPRLDLARYKALCDEAMQDKSVCFRCGRPRPTRYRRVCSRCGHFVCPQCGACFCKKRISHIR